MAMASNEIGRVSVRVVPDFTYFRKIMRAVLKEFDNKEITVHVKANAKELKQVVKDAKEASVQAQKAIKQGAAKGAKEASKSAKIEPGITLTSRYKTRMQSQLNKLLSDLEVDLLVNGKNRGEKDYLAALREQFDKDAKYIQNLLNKLSPEMDRRQFAADAAWIKATMNKLRADINKAPVNKILDTADMNLKIEESKGNIKKWAAEQKEVFDKWNLQLSGAIGTIRNMDDAFDYAFKGQGAQALREYVYKFRDLDGHILRATSRLDGLRMRGGLLGSIFGGAGALYGAKQALGIIGKTTTALGTLGQTLSKFTPSFGTGLNIAAYALIASLIMPALALVSGLITAAPAALAAVAVPIAAIALGLEGIGKAAETAKPAFDKLRADISGVFEQSMVPGFTTLRDKIIPGVTESFKGVAQSLSNLFNETLANLGTESNMGYLNNIIKNVGIAAQAAVPGVKNFTDGILKLVSTLSTKFPGLSAAFNRVSESFVNWVDKITKPDANGVSQLDTAMRTLGTTLSQLGGIVSDLFSQGFNNLSDPKFGSSMVSFVSDIRSLVSEVLPSLASSFQGIATALRPITATVETLSGLMDKINGSVTVGNKDGIQMPLPDMGGLERIKFTWDAIFNREQAAKQVAEWALAAGQSAMQGMASAGSDAAKAYQEGVSAALTQNQEMFSNQPWALGATGINEQVTNQITTQAQAAIDGARQALVPLQEGLQTDINNALMPLGDIAGKVTAAFGETPTLVRGALSQVPGIVTETLGAVGPAADGAMKLLNDSIVAGSAVALLTAQNQAPLIVQPFKDMAKGMAEVGAAMMQGLGGGIRDNVGIAKEAAAQAAIEVKEAAKAAIRSKSPSKDFMDIGRDTQTGLAIGIDNHAKGPIAAIREVMQAIKDVFGSAEGLNLNFFMNEAASSMSSIATSSKEFRSNMVEAGTSPILSSESGAGKLSMTESELEDLKRQKADNALRIAELQAQKNQTEDKAAKKSLQGEIDALQIQQKRLDLLKQEAPLQEERKTAIQQLSDTIATNIIDTIKMPGDFAKATVNAAAQDLGISGNGALPTIANWALDAGTNFIFNVNNMDDALAGQQAQQRKQQVGITGR